LSAALRRNVELKAHDPHPARTLGRCLRLPAEDQGELWQRDTYFSACRGRLKLREQPPGNAQLIHYERDMGRAQRVSRYKIVEVRDADTLRSVLADALEVRVTVVKRRRLLLWQSVRIHLDAVEDLGSFIELEAVAEPSSDLRLEYRQVAALRESLEITDDLLIAAGYAELLRNSEAGRAAI
jgi:predicted adenylyl cyclase CyaB